MSNDNGLLSWRDAIIRDGAEQSGYIAEIDQLYPSVEFRYRPMLGMAAEVHASKTAKIDDPEQMYREMAKVIVNHVKHWSIPSEINMDNVMRLRRHLLLRMHMIVIGGASDENPNGDTDAPEATAKK